MTPPNLPTGRRGEEFEFSFRTRHSSWESLKNNSSFDVTIIGGGIVGAGVARQLAFAGLKRILLIEKNDFASGTSSASSKLIHAGIRYLEQSWNHLKSMRLGEAVRNFWFVVQASQERKVLGKMAPGLVKPKIIYLILSKDDHRNIFSVLVGVWAYYLIQIFQGQFFSRPRLYLTSPTIDKVFPGLKHSEIKAILSFWDSETDDARLVIDNLQDASRRGVEILNYVEMIKCDEKEGAVHLELVNKENSERTKIQSSLVINATGAWIDEVRRRISRFNSVEKLVDRVAGGHIDVYPVVTPYSFYITAPDGRLVFVLRREEDGFAFSRIGTTERPLRDEELSDGIKKPSNSEVQYLKNVVHQYFPEAPLDTANLLHLDEGIRPLQIQSGAAFNKSRGHRFVMEGRFIHVVGVKLTDFRRAAGELMQAISWNSWALEPKTLKTIHEPLRPAGSKMYREESIEKLVQHTMVLHWDDVVERRRGRLPAFEKKYKPDQFKKDLSEMARVMGWDSARLEMERSRVALD